MIEIDETYPLCDNNYLHEIHVELLPYQLATVHQMELLENRNDINKGILANKTGSGKSITILAVCVRNKMVKGSEHSSLSNLIVVPSILIKQWEDELHETSLKFITIKTKNMCNSLHISDLIEYDVILCSNSFYIKFIDNLPKDCLFNRVIFDDIYYNKLPLYNFSWIITNDDLYWTNSDLSYGEIIKYNIKNIDSYMNFDIEKKNIFYTESDLINDFFLCESLVLTENDILNNKRKEIDDLQKESSYLEQQKKNFPANKYEKCENYFEILENDDDKIKIKKTKDKIDLLKIKLYLLEEIMIINNKIKTIKNKSISLETKLKSTEEKIKRINNDNCPVCLDNFKIPVITNCCENLFCYNCIITSLNIKKKCMLCRRDLYVNDLTIIAKTPLLTKNQNILNIINQNPSGKFLIFSYYKHTYNIKQILNTTYNSEELKGGMNKVNKIVEKYKKTNKNIILINEKYNGNGINLENVTDIIFYDKPKTNIKEEKTIGRALRLGRDKNLKLKIHYFNN